MKTIKGENDAALLDNRALLGPPPEVVADPLVDLFYIDHSAFGILAQTNERAAVAVSRGLAAMRVRRLMGNMLGEGSVTGIPHDIPRGVLQATAESDFYYLTLRDLFQHIGYRDRSDADGGYVPLLDERSLRKGRSLRELRTCMDEDHYTIPSTKVAERFMDHDNVDGKNPFRVLNPIVAAGLGREGLVVIHGTDTTGLPDPNPAEGWQPDLLVFPRFDIPADSAELTQLREQLVRDLLEPDEVRNREVEVREAYIASLLKDLGEIALGSNDPNAQAVLKETERIIKKRMDSPSFGHRQAWQNENGQPDLLPKNELVQYIGPHRWAAKALVTQIVDVPSSESQRVGRVSEFDHFVDSVGAIRGKQELKHFFLEVTTPSERRLLQQRLRIAEMLFAGTSPTEIASELRVSKAMVARAYRRMNNRSA